MIDEFKYGAEMKIKNWLKLISNFKEIGARLQNMLDLIKIQKIVCIEFKN